MIRHGLYYLRIGPLRVDGEPQPAIGKNARWDVAVWVGTLRLSMLAFGQGMAHENHTSPGS